MLDQIKSENTTLVALSPQTEDFNFKMIESHCLEFDILTDPGNAYAAKLGLRFEVPANIREIYEDFKINLAGTNGDDSWTLPIPGRIIVAQDGVVRDIDADPDYTVRPEPSTTIDRLKKLNNISDP